MWFSLQIFRYHSLMTLTKCTTRRQHYLPQLGVNITFLTFTRDGITSVFIGLKAVTTQPSNIALVVRRGCPMSGDSGRTVYKTQLCCKDFETEQGCSLVRMLERVDLYCCIWLNKHIIAGYLTYRIVLHFQLRAVQQKVPINAGLLSIVKFQ